MENNEEIVLTPEEAAKEMEKIVDIKEAEEEEKLKIESIEREERKDRETVEKEQRIANWIPKTQLGRDVLAGKIKTIDEILNSGMKIMEDEIIDYLLNVRIELLNIGQAKGKFGGGKRRGWKQTQKKTEEGNRLSFSVMAVIGDEDGHLGLGFARASETFPAKEKAIRKAKMNIMNVRRGCASYDCLCKETHSIPSKISGKCSSYEIVLMPAPQGTGLVVGDEVKKILKLAGIKDVYGKSFGKSRTTINVGKACIAAFENLNRVILK
jgi:small subunit ribosomal protein S5